MHTQQATIGELRHIHKLRFWPLDDVLHDKYLLSREEAKLIASFLNAMLRLHPDQRASAADMLKHPLISGIVVQGEVDQIVRAEEEAKKRGHLEGLASPVEDPSSSGAVPMDVEPEVLSPVSGAPGGGKGEGAKNKKKKKKRANAALANADIEAIEHAEATVVQRALDDANAMKPIEGLDEEESPARTAAPTSRSQVNVARDRTTSSQRPGST